MTEPAGRRRWRTLLGSATVQYGAGYFTFLACRLARDLLFARQLGPDLFSFWAGLTVFRQYSAYSDLGFTNGLGRVLPRLLGRGDPTGARRAMGLAWIVAMAATTICGVGALIWAARTDAGHDVRLALAVGAGVMLMFLDKQYMYVGVVLRSSGRVGEAGLWSGALGVLELLVGAALVAVWGLAGVFASIVASSALVVALMSARQPLRAELRIDRRTLKELASASAVLLGFGLATVALNNVDRLALLMGGGGGGDLGRYHLAALIGLVVGQIPYVLMAVLAPQIYRHGPEEADRLGRFLLLPSAVIAVVGVAVVAVLWLLLPPVVHTFFPAYVAAIPIARVLMLANLVLSVAMVAENVTVALDRGWRALAARWASVALALGGGLWALASGRGPFGVAVAMAVAQTAGGVAVVAIALRGVQVGLGRYLVAALGPIAYGAGVLLLLGEGLDTGGSAAGPALLRLLICLAVLSPLALLPLAYEGRGPLVGSAVLRFLRWSAPPSGEPTGGR
jgi:O-antigen/teichoic acid export membrane protein